MTVDDAKKELCKIESNLNIYSCSMYRLVNENNANKNGFSTNSENWIPLLDEEKIGLSF